MDKAGTVQVWHTNQELAQQLAHEARVYYPVRGSHMDVLCFLWKHSKETLWALVAKVRASDINTAFRLTNTWDDEAFQGDWWEREEILWHANPEDFDDDYTWQLVNPMHGTEEGDVFVWGDTRAVMWVNEGWLDLYTGEWQAGWHILHLTDAHVR